ncbi:MAG: Acyl-CoA dehydrogenase [Myxococcota bacterium]|nr:Acyl-CoA dehydrogenase [Myxococcota bacterium]
MDFELTEQQRLFRDGVRAFVEKEVAPFAALWDREHRFPVELMPKLGAAGLLAVQSPESTGGTGAGPIEYSLAITELARACASTSVTVAVTNLCSDVIRKFGNDAQKQRFIPRLASGEAVAGSFCLSEPHCGSDAAALRTHARRDGGDYIINGSKNWITNGGHAGVYIVMATVNRELGPKGICAFIVEKRTPGLITGKEERKMGLRASNTVSLAFEDMRVPAENLLGREGDGFRIALASLDGGRIGVASQSVGIAEAAQAAAIRYARDRKAFGEPIANFQAIQWMIADNQVDIETSRFLALRAAWLSANGKPFSREAAMAKVAASEAANRVVNRAVQIHGGYGYIGEFPVERYFRDAKVTTIYEGSSEIQRIVISREVIQGSRA